MLIDAVNICKRPLSFIADAPLAFQNLNFIKLCI